MDNPIRARIRPILSKVGEGFVTIGVVIFLFVAFQLWGTGFQEQKSQNQLADQLDEILSAVAADAPVVVATSPVIGEVTPTTEAPADSQIVTTSGGPGADVGGSVNVGLGAPADLDAPVRPESPDPELLAAFFPADGAALARLEIPAIELDKVTVRGVGVADLRKGPGHYPNTAQPGLEGNVGIAGHRTTYGAPFGRIDELSPGDEIVLTGTQGRSVYRVSDPRVAFSSDDERILEFGDGYIIVDPSAVWVLDDFGDSRVTLTACNPKYSARQRIIVTAELVAEPAVLPDWVLDEKARRSEVLVADPGDSGQAPVAVTVAVSDTTVPELVLSDPGDVSDATNEDWFVAQGLDGDQTAIPGAVLWMLAALLSWVGGGIIARRLAERKVAFIAYRLAGLIPTLAFRWFSFQLIDRALPAY